MAERAHWFFVKLVPLYSNKAVSSGVDPVALYNLPKSYFAFMLKPPTASATTISTDSPNGISYGPWPSITDHPPSSYVPSYMFGAFVGVSKFPSGSISSAWCGYCLPDVI